MSDLSQVSAPRSSYIAIFVAALATLMLQVLVSRIVSVTYLYHFSFAVITLAMLGMTLGALWVFLYPKRLPYTGFDIDTIATVMQWFGLAAAIAITAHLMTPARFEFVSLVIHAVIFLIPFTLGGVVITLLLTRFTASVSQLYAVDLVGAGLGCIGTIFILWLTDAITAVFLLSSLLYGVGFFLPRSFPRIRYRFVYTVLGVGLFGLTVTNFVTSIQRKPFLSVQGRIGKDATQRTLFTGWNSHSRVALMDWGNHGPIGWGISPKQSHKYPAVQHYKIDIDGSAATYMIGTRGDLTKAAYLKIDISNIAYHMRSIQSTAIIGVGAGRDVLSALVFGAKRVLGVELNSTIVDLVTRRYADFVGNIHKRPGVTIVADEARSYLSRTNERFDMIQVSLVDTWAATAAGAFSLSENSLYTVDAWRTLMGRLTPTGLLSFSRWFQKHRHVGELYRMVTIGVKALQAHGVKDTSKHFVAVHLPSTNVVTLLTSRSPITATDIASLEKACQTLGFEVLYTPTYTQDVMLKQLASGQTNEAFFDAFPINIRPPDDNHPFYFNMERFSLRWQSNVKKTDHMNAFNHSAVSMLSNILIVVLILAVLLILIPLLLHTKPGALRGSLRFIGYFATIGLAFMFIEISQMQRLMIYLGHPTYALVVILFTLLISSGLGSYTTHTIQALEKETWRFFGLLGCIVVFGFLSPLLIEQFRYSNMGVRIFLSVLSLFPIGLFMGMAFPIGMKLANLHQKTHLTPWFWGINGATSVLCSVVAVIISMIFGIHFTYWVGAVCYLFCAILFFTLKQGPSTQAS